MTATPRLYPPPERLGVLSDLVGTPMSLEELKNKPGRRRTLRALGPTGTVIVKLYASDRAATVAARIAALNTGPPEPTLPRLLWVEPAKHIVVLSEVPGRPLREALLAGHAPDCRRAGEALGAWHRAWRSRSPAELRRHTVERELEILERRAERAPAAVGRAVRSLARDLSAPWPCPTVIHRDLYEEQVLLGERVGLIDLDDAALGPPELDVGNLLAHVQLLSLRSGLDLSTPCDHFLARYASSAGRLDRDLLDRCRRLTLLRLVCIHQEPALLEPAVAGVSFATGSAAAGGAVPEAPK
jgi:aminoglycoside phosphotransferase (APT) family kinase protein